MGKKEMETEGGPVSEQSGMPPERVCEREGGKGEREERATRKDNPGEKRR